MALESIIIWLVVGALAGWLAGVIVRGYGFGLVGNMIVGVVGSFIGGLIFAQLHLLPGGGLLGGLIGATLGAVLLLLLLRLMRRRSLMQRLFPRR